MLKRLANKLVMYHGVQSHLNQNKELWTVVPAMVEIVNDFEALLAKIETYQQLIKGNKNGITKQKAAQQDVIIAHTYELSSLVYVAATKKNDMVLAAQVNFTPTKLLKKRDSTLVATCLSFVETATGHLAELSDYPITAEELLVLKEEINRFAENISSGRVSVSEGKAANENMKQVFLQVDALLKNQLDRMMVRYRKTKPKFFAMYHELRRIIHYGVRHAKPKEPEKEA